MDVRRCVSIPTTLGNYLTTQTTHTMSLAREINQKLDEISAIKAEMEVMKSDLSGDSGLTNVETGDTMTVDDALFVAEGVLKTIYQDLDKLTNEGRNARDLFTNTFYINDLSQDKKIANELNAPKLQKKTDEIKTHDGKTFPPSSAFGKPEHRKGIEALESEFYGKVGRDEAKKMTKEEFMKKWRKFNKDKDKNKNNDWLN